MSKWWDKSKLGGTVGGIVDFAFGRSKDMDDEQFMDMRCRIPTREFNEALVFFGMLDEYYSCKPAKTVKGLLERLSISYKGDGRKEAVLCLVQQFPKVETIETDLDEDLKKFKEEVG